MICQKALERLQLVLLSEPEDTSLRQLAGVSTKELTALHGFGPKALRLIQEALEQRGQSLR